MPWTSNATYYFTYGSQVLEYSYLPTECENCGYTDIDWTLPDEDGLYLCPRCRFIIEGK